MQRQLRLHVIRYKTGWQRSRATDANVQMRKPLLDRTAMNHAIWFPSMRLLAPDDEGKERNVGVVSRQEALQMAKESGLDLIVVSKEANPPVCKLVNADKLRYDAAKKQREAKRAMTAAQVKKDIKISVGISDHDYSVRLSSIKNALSVGDKVRVVVSLFGFHKEPLALQIFERVTKDVAALGAPTSQPAQHGMNMETVFAPKPQARSSAGAKPG